MSKRDASLTADELDFAIIEKRGGKRSFHWWLLSGYLIKQLSPAYPTPPDHMRNMQRLRDMVRRRWGMGARECDNPRVTGHEIPEGTIQPPAGNQVEHPVPLVAGSRFAAVAHHGRHWAPRVAGYMRSDRNGGDRPWGQVTPEGPPTSQPAIASEAFWRDMWNANSLPAGLPRVSPGSPDIRNPAQRMYEAIGSNTNAAHFTLLEASINGIKGRIEIFAAPMADVRFTEYVVAALNPSHSESARDTSIQSFMAPLRENLGVFQYLNAPDLVTRVDTTIAAVHAQLLLTEQHIPEARGYVLPSS